MSATGKEQVAQSGIDEICPNEIIIDHFNF